MLTILPPLHFMQTWMGDPARALQAAEQIRIIEQNDLVKHTAEMGVELHETIASLSKKHPKVIQNLRGKGEGTFLAFDCDTPAQRDALVAQMRQRGVLVGGSGARAVRLRPLLIFGKSELAIFAQALEDSVEHVAGSS